MEKLELARDIDDHPAGTPIEILDTLPTGWIYVQTLHDDHVTAVIAIRPEDIRRTTRPHQPGDR